MLSIFKRKSRTETTPATDDDASDRRSDGRAPCDLFLNRFLNGHPYLCVGVDVSRAGISRRLRIAAERLGPTYIKLGQIISSGQGIFPAELVDEFSLLRDKVPAELGPRRIPVSVMLDLQLPISRT